MRPTSAARQCVHLPLRRLTNGTIGEHLLTAATPTPGGATRETSMIFGDGSGEIFDRTLAMLSDAVTPALYDSASRNDSHESLCSFTHKVH